MHIAAAGEGTAVAAAWQQHVSSRAAWVARAANQSRSQHVGQYIGLGIVYSRGP